MVNPSQKPKLKRCKGCKLYGLQNKIGTRQILKMLTTYFGKNKDNVSVCVFLWSELLHFQNLY